MIPSWDDYFMKMAVLASERSTCLRRKVGALLVKDKRVLSTGYNGAPSGITHCIDRGCLREKLNIPSGERHELCLHGDTVIKLLDGTYKQIREIAEKKEAVWVYSVDIKTGKIVPALAKNPRKIGESNDLLRIYLDNGKSFICTKDHRILLRSLKYMKAENLKEGNSLMPMYYNFASNGRYESISNTIKTRMEGKSTVWKEEYGGRSYSTLTHHIVYEYFYGQRKDIIHHINENFLDNRPLNLKNTSRGDHTSLHNKNFSKEHFKKIGVIGHKAQRELIRNNTEFRNRKIEASSKNMSSNWAKKSFRENMKSTQKTNGESTAKRTNSDLECIEKRKQGRILAGISRLISKSQEILTSENYEKERKKYPIAKKLGEKGNPAPKIDTILKSFPSIENAIIQGKTYNHRVVKIVELKDTHSVYCMEVPKYENFAIDLGDNSCVFVHNCRAIHAEQNCIIQAACYGTSIQGSILYCTLFPCIICSKMLINAKVEKIIYLEGYPDTMSKEMLVEAKIPLLQFHLGEETK